MTITNVTIGKLDGPGRGGGCNGGCNGSGGCNGGGGDLDGGIIAPAPGGGEFIFCKIVLVL
tara:strand:- start:387 stop:569 length:183 start_codon:yes stop_codon:yes gene_type:complete